MQPRGTMSADAGGQGRVFDATLSDGSSAAARSVQVRIVDQGLRLEPADESGGNGELWPWQELVSNGPLLRHESPLLAHRRRTGVRLFIRDPAIVDVLLKHAPQLSPHAYRRRVTWPLLALAAILLALGAWLWFSSFSLARMVADMLPQSFHAALGRAVLHDITKGRICTGEAGSRALERMRATLDDGSAPVRVMVARLGMVNAFTLPGGYIVLSEKLVRQARAPGEVAGVLAHEMGHAAYRHPEASLVRAGGLSLLGSIIFGDSSLGGLATLLVQLRFSRQAEEEADAFAAARLRAAGEDPALLAEFLQRIAGDDAKGGRLAEMLSTHPLTERRAEALKARHLPNARPLLDVAQWLALRRICTRTRDLEQVLKARAP